MNWLVRVYSVLSSFWCDICNCVFLFFKLYSLLIISFGVRKCSISIRWWFEHIKFNHFPSSNQVWNPLEPSSANRFCYSVLAHVNNINMRMRIDWFCSMTCVLEVIISRNQSKFKKKSEETKNIFDWIKMKIFDKNTYLTSKSVSFEKNYEAQIVCI